MSNVISLPKATISDISQVLRSIADEIDAGVYGEASMAVLVLECGDGEIECFGAGGGADHYRGIAMLHKGLNKLCS